MTFLMIDNFDSFVHNLARYFEIAGIKCEIMRNNKIDLKIIPNYDAIILSPGPCKPDDAGACLEIVKQFSAHIPIFGVCLGQQIIAQSFGAPIIKTNPVHGRASMISHNGDTLFENIPQNFEAGRYHSLINDFTSAPDLEIIARTEDNIPMAIRHKTYPAYGVQFHPESILTPYGHRIIENFVVIAAGHKAKDIAA